MALKFPSSEWADAFGESVNANEAYRSAAAQWTEGAIAFVCKAEPELGIDTDHGMVLDLFEGRCRGVVYTTDRAAIDSTPFVIEATYARWQKVIAGDVEPIKAMMQGKLKLTRGHLPTIIRDVEGSKQLVLSASHIETEFQG